MWGLFLFAVLLLLSLCWMVVALPVGELKKYRKALVIDITLIGLFLAAMMIDCSVQREVITVGKIAYKQYWEPTGSGQSPYAILVVKEDRQYLFRVPEDDFFNSPDYNLDRRIPIIIHRGLFSGYPYHVTLHQPKEYVHQ